MFGKDGPWQGHRGNQPHVCGVVEMGVGAALWGWLSTTSGSRHSDRMGQFHLGLIHLDLVFGTGASTWLGQKSLTLWVWDETELQEPTLTASVFQRLAFSCVF